MVNVEPWLDGAALEGRLNMLGDKLARSNGVLCPPAGVDTGCQFLITLTNQGNSALQPENATTISGGVILTPHWIEGLTLSMDWYSITIKNAVFAASANQVVNQCFNHSAAACSASAHDASTRSSPHH